MSEVEFNEGEEFHVRSRALLGEPITPTMITFLLKKGWVKNEKQALYVLLVFVGIFFALSGFILMRVNNSSASFVNLPNGTKVTIDEYVEGLKSGIFNP